MSKLTEKKWNLFEHYDGVYAMCSFTYLNNLILLNMNTKPTAINNCVIIYLKMKR